MGSTAKGRACKAHGREAASRRAMAEMEIGGIGSVASAETSRGMGWKATTNRSPINHMQQRSEIWS